jgi:hypothetical protein
MPPQFQHSDLQDNRFPDPGLQDSDLQDLDLQDIQFLMETVVPDQAQLELDGEDECSDEPTVVADFSIDAEKAFLLINKVLPLEACLHHQILPLYVEGPQIFLGMVDLEDRDALEYARMILGYQKLQVVTQTIPAKAHHQILQGYLFYQRQVESQHILPPPAHPLPATLPDAAPSVNQDQPTQDQPTIDSVSELVDCESTVNTVDEAPDSTPVADSLNESLDSPQTLQLLNQDVLTQWPIALHGRAAQPQLPPESTPFQAPVLSQKPVTPQKTKPTQKTVQIIPGSALPELRLYPVRGALRSLPPQAFLHNLLLKVLQSGVGRLFLARQDGVGRVLWTESGVVKAALEEIGLDQLQGAIDELKVLTRLPREAVKAPVEVEIERLYQNQRVLLRLRITPKSTGEEATLQILRGVALKFYQQQQLKTLSRDTLTIADELRRKIVEFQRRTQTAVDQQDTAIIPELDRVIGDLEQRLSEIKQIRSTLVDGQSSEG